MSPNYLKSLTLLRLDPLLLKNNVGIAPFQLLYVILSLLWHTNVSIKFIVHGA
jgi:hypothetical protein